MQRDRFSRPAGNGNGERIAACWLLQMRPGLKNKPMSREDLSDIADEERLKIARGMELREGEELFFNPNRRNRTSFIGDFEEILGDGTLIIISDGRKHRCNPVNAFRPV